jgi:cytochrome d ubiquinol oxidase subunit I
MTGLLLSLAIIFLGHFQLINLAKWQPVKNAAMEGTFQTRKGAWLYAIGWLDVKNRKSYSIGIPNALSFLDTGNIRAKIEGLDNILERGQDEFAKEGKDEYLMYEPPVQTIFQTFHFMVLLGLFLIGLFFYAVIICLKNTWQEKPWVWNMFIFSIPLPFLASELGWVSAEMGRQPWLVYGLLKTSAGISTVPLSYVVFSLSTYSILYIIFFIVLIKWVPKIIKENLA